MLNLRINAQYIVRTIYNIVIVSFVNILLNEFFWTKKNVFSIFSPFKPSLWRKWKPSMGSHVSGFRGMQSIYIQIFSVSFFLQFCVLNFVKSQRMEKNKDFYFRFSFKERLNVTFAAMLKTYLLMPTFKLLNALHLQTKIKVVVFWTLWLYSFTTEFTQTRIFVSHKHQLFKWKMPAQKYYRWTLSIVQTVGVVLELGLLIKNWEWSLRVKQHP